MKKVGLLLILFLFYMNSLYAEKIQVILKDNICEIKFEIITSCSKSLLLDICYQPHHLKNFLDSEINTKLAEEKRNYYKLQYEYQYLCYVEKAVFERRILKEDSIVEFKMISFDQNFNLFPRVISSRGYYKIQSISKNKNRIIYYEKIVLSEKPSWLWVKLAKVQYNKFYSRLKNYIHTFE